MTHTSTTSREGDAVSAVAARRPPGEFAYALRDTFRSGYGMAGLRADVLAGIVVGTVALPLSMALAIASGVPPEHGLYTAILAGGVIALCGGSRVQVSGPTAAFVVILSPITHQYGVTGLLLATLLAGVILVIMGLGGFGKLIEFIPYPVTTGFTAGIAIVIATLQLKDFFGLTVEHMPEKYLERVYALVMAAPTFQVGDVVIGCLTLAMLLLIPRLTRRVPGPIVALPIAAVAAWWIGRHWPQLQPATIHSRFGGIPRTLPSFSLPWTPRDGMGVLSIRSLLGPAFAIAMLGAIESLLSAVIADGMTGRKHNPDAELVGQGIGNIVGPFFGGIAATGAIARTATNIRAGGSSPFAAVTHAVFVLASMLLLAPWLGYLPMSGLAALLLIVAWNMSEARHAVRIVRIGPRSDSVVLGTCLGLTVIFDMVVSVSVGVVLAALLFMRRMAELSSVTLVREDHPALAEPLPQGVVLYEIAGPLFFGAAQKAVSALRSIIADVRVVILDLSGVPTMDATGLVNLESALEGLHAGHVRVVIVGAQKQPLRLMAKAGWKHRPWLNVHGSYTEGIAAARALAASHGGAQATAVRSKHA